MQKKNRNMTLSINRYNETLFISDYTQFWLHWAKWRDRLGDDIL